MLGLWWETCSEQRAAAFVVLPLLTVVFFIAFDHEYFRQDLQLWVWIRPCQTNLIAEGYLLRDLILLWLNDAFVTYNDIVSVAVYANTVGPAQATDHLVSVGLGAGSSAFHPGRKPRCRSNVKRVLLVVPQIVSRHSCGIYSVFLWRRHVLLVLWRNETAWGLFWAWISTCWVAAHLLRSRQL